MYLQQRRITQVKCNFCMEWMKLCSDVKYSVNICEQCLKLGYEDKNLHAVSSNGSVYQLYLVEKNAKIQPQSNKEQQRVKRPLGQPIRDSENINENSDELLEEIDQYRNTQIRDLIAEWKKLSQKLKGSHCLGQSQSQSLQSEYQKHLLDIRNLNSKLQQSVNVVLSSAKRPLQQNQTEIKPQPQVGAFNDISSIVNNKANLKSEASKKMQKSFSSAAGKQNYELKLQSNCKSVKETEELKFQAVNINFSLESESAQMESSNLEMKPIRLQTQCFDESFMQELTLPDLNRQTDRSFKSHLSKDSISRGLSSRSSLANLDEHSYKARRTIVEYLQNSYTSVSLARLMLNLVFEAYLNVSVIGKSMELIACNLKHIDFRCFLETLEWKEVEVLKFVKCKLSNQQFRMLIEFLQQHSLNSVKTLVLTANLLTDECVDFLIENPISTVKEIYFGKNRMKYYQVRGKVAQLAQRGQTIHT